MTAAMIHHARTILVLMAMTAGMFAPCVAASDPSLVVSPKDGPVNAPFDVKVRGLRPGDTVTLTAERTDTEGRTWTSSAVATANRRGVADLATQPSLSGTYQGVSPHGLFCSVLPVPPERLDGYVANFPQQPGQPSVIATPLEPSPITVRATIAGREIGVITASRGYAVGVAGVEVAGPTGWRGEYYPPAPGRPVGEPVVVLTGSGGGLFRTTAALLASNGHPTLALGLYNYKDLPKTLHLIPLEHVGDGSRWLAQRSNRPRVAVLGISRGSEAAQLAAAYFPDAFSAVIAQVPSHLIGGALGQGTTPEDPAWSVGGRPLQPVTGLNLDVARMAELAKVLPGYRETLDFLPAWNDPATEAASGIPYERIKAPLLVLAAGDDDIWPSYVSAERIRRRMGGRAEVHVFPDAGHWMVFVGRGNTMSHFAYNPALNGFMSGGGTPTGNCEGSYQAFEQTLRFLRRVGGK